MELEAEYGSIIPVGFLQPTLHESSGKEIEIPKCPRCKHSMCQVVGKEAFAWMCFTCYNKSLTS